MAAPNTSRSRFRSLSQKITGPTFRTGIGEVYRELERQGKIPAEGIEKTAEYEEQKKAKEAARERPSAIRLQFKKIADWFNSQFD